MSLGIVGVCIGDVNFTSRHHNTNLGNPSQRTRDKQKNFPLKGQSNVKDAQNVHLNKQKEILQSPEQELNAQIQKLKILFVTKRTNFCRCHLIMFISRLDGKLKKISKS